MATTPDDPRGAAVPRGWVLRYLLGSIVVIAFFVGGLISTDHAVAELADNIRAANLSSCGATPQPQCRADYPAVLADVGYHEDPVAVSINSRFRRDPSIACLHGICGYLVDLRSPDATGLHRGQRVTISAGGGRIYRIIADGLSRRTFDDPSISVLNAASSLTWALWIDAFGTAWLVAYLFMILNLRLWRVPSSTFRRSLNMVSLVSLAGSVAAFLAFALGGAQALVVLAAGLLISAAAGALARRHPEVRQPVAEFTPNEHWRTALNRSILTGCWVIFIFPLPLGIAVAFLLAHDEGTWIGPLLSTLVGIALTALIIWRVRRRIAGRPRAT